MPIDTIIYTLLALSFVTGMGMGFILSLLFHKK